MTKFKLFFTLFIVLSFSSNSNAAYPDYSRFSIERPDIQAHAIVSGMGVLIGSAVLKGARIEAPTLTASALVLAAGLAKELIDARPDTADLAGNFIGVIGGATLSVAFSF